MGGEDQVQTAEPQRATTEESKESLVLGGAGSTISSLGITARARQTGGVVIIEMERGSVAEKAGLHVGYIITSLDGKTLASPVQLETGLQNQRR